MSRLSSTTMLASGNLASDTGARHQDRLVKLMGAEGILTLETADRYLEEVYLPECQELFTVPPSWSFMRSGNRMPGFDAFPAHGFIRCAHKESRHV